MPNFTNVNFRLTKAFTIAEKYRINLMADTFNLFNNTMRKCGRNNGLYLPCTAKFCGYGSILRGAFERLFSPIPDVWRSHDNFWCALWRPAVADGIPVRILGWFRITTQSVDSSKRLLNQGAASFFGRTTSSTDFVPQDERGKFLSRRSLDKFWPSGTWKGNFR